MLEDFYPNKMFSLLIASPLQQPSSEQQSRIDSGISTGGDVEGSGISLTQTSGAVSLLTPAPSTVTRTRSLAGHGRVNRTTAGGINQGVGRVTGASHSQSQHLMRGKSQDSGNFGDRNASEGTGLDHKGLLRRDVSSFDCERGMDRSQEQSQDRLLLGESREGLLDSSSKIVASPNARSRDTHLSCVTIATEGRNTRADNKRESKYTSEETWWDSKGLQPGDYASLAAIILTEIFSSDILTPMDDEDTTFQIEVSGVNLTRYTEMLRLAPTRSDLDPLLMVHAPRGNAIKVPSPYLDVLNFFPPARRSPSIRNTSATGAATRAAMWGASIAERLSLRVKQRENDAYVVAGLPFDSSLMIPPPVPHPAVIAVIIYNREATDPIVLGSTDTQNVLMSMEDSLRQSEQSSGLTSLEESSSDSSPPSSPPSLYEGATYTPGEGTGDSRTATLPLSAALEIQSPIHYHKHYGQTHSCSEVPSPDRQNYGPFGVMDPNPLRSLLESHPPFSVSLDLAPAEDPPENDYEDALRTRHATDSLNSRKSRGGSPTAVWVCYFFQYSY